MYNLALENDDDSDRHCYNNWLKSLAFAPLSYDNLIINACSNY